MWSLLPDLGAGNGVYRHGGVVILAQHRLTGLRIPLGVRSVGRGQLAEGPPASSCGEDKLQPLLGGRVEGERSQTKDRSQKLKENILFFVHSLS